MFIFSTLDNNTSTAISYKRTRIYSLKLALITLTLVILSILFLDQKITWLFKEDDWKWLFAREITNIGLFSHYFFIALAGLAISFYFIKIKKNTSAQVIRFLEKSKVLVYTLLFSGIWVHIFKFLFGRQRPKISPDFSPHVFQPLTTNWDFHSLPSGHTQVLFCVASFLAFYYPRYRYFFFILAGLLSFTRVMTRDHFFADVMMGALVGHLSTVWLYTYLIKKNVIHLKNQ